MVAFAVSISIAVCPADIALFLYLFLLIVFTFALLVYTIFGEGRRNRLTLLSTLATLWIVSAVFVAYHVQIRTTARWLWRSRAYKDKVLAQQAPANGEFRHVDGMAGAGLDRTPTVFLVFDPGIRSRQLLDIINRESSTGYPVRFLKLADWKASGMPLLLHQSGLGPVN